MAATSDVYEFPGIAPDTVRGRVDVKVLIRR